MTEDDYLYTGYNGTYKIDLDKSVNMTITGFEKLRDPSSVFSCVDEEEMKEFLYRIGPLSIALNADPLQTYSLGTIDLTAGKCPSNGINHAALFVMELTQILE